MERAGLLSSPVLLRVLKVSPRTLVLYRRLGFVSTGEADTHDLMGMAQNHSSRPTH